MKMFGSILFLFFISLISVALPRPIFASCSLDQGSRQYSAKYTLTDSGSAQCKPPNNKPDGPYTVWCDTQTEAYAADSVRQPLCGSSEERGKANSTCWNCGSTVKCDGLDFALGSTDPFISQIHNPANPGDTNTDQVWRIPNSAIPNTIIPDTDPPKPGFLYNGLWYPKPSGDIIACGSNNLACGSSEECTNITYPDINNRGNNGSSPQTQCQTITRTTSVVSDTDISLSARGTPKNVTGTETKNLIDVGGPTDPKAPQLSTLFGNSLVTDPTITGLYQVNLNDGTTPIPKDEKSNWGVTLIELQTSPGGAIFAPKSGYDIGGGYAYTVLYASPTELTLKATREDNAVYGYTLHFADLNVDPTLLNAYLANENNRSNQLVAIPCGFQIGTPIDSKLKVGIADTGTFIDPRVRKDWWHEPANNTCASIQPGLVTPLTTQICTTTEFGTPDVTSKIPIPNLINFGATTNTNKEGQTFLLSFESILPRPIKGFLGFLDKRLDEPSIFEKFGKQLDAAMPYMIPDAVTVQPIVQEYTHSITSVLCFASDNPAVTKAFPLKQIIQAAAPGVNKVWQNGRMMAGLEAPNVSVEKLEYEHLGERYPNVLGKIDTSPGCDEPPLAQSVRKVNTGTTDPEYYDTTKDQSPFYDITKWFGSVVSGMFCSLVNNCNLTANPWMNAYEKLKTPYIDNINVNLANDQSGKAVGALATFVPASFTIANEHGKVDNQKIAQNIGSNAETLNASINYKYAKGIERYADFTNCSVRPAELQSSLGFSCNFADNDVTADRPLAGGTDPNFPVSSLGSVNSAITSATSGEIPACVLEGVKYIETGTQTDFSGTCIVNACSAAGPFQVTTGAAPAPGGGWDTHCTQCGPSWADGSRTCPDGWPGNWPQTASDPSPCSDVNASAARAVQMLQEKATVRCETLDNRPATDQREAIITAGNSYFGSSESIGRLGGCAYGEFVYKHCDPSYVCGTANVDLATKYDQCQKQKGL